MRSQFYLSAVRYRTLWMVNCFTTAPSTRLRATTWDVISATDCGSRASNRMVRFTVVCTIANAQSTFYTYHDIDMITSAHQLTPMHRATPSRQIAHLAVLKVGRWLWSTGDGRRRLLTAVGQVRRRRQVLSTQNDDCRLFQCVRLRKLDCWRALLTTLNVRRSACRDEIFRSAELCEQ